MIFPYFHSVCLLSALLSLSTTFNGVVEFGGCIIHQQLWNNQPCLPDPWKGFLKNFYYGVANKISLGGDRRQECRRRLFCLRSSSRQTTKTPDSQLRLEPAALSEEAGCSAGEGRRGIFETRHRLRPPREGRNDWGSKFRRPTLPAHPYSGFHTLEPLHTLYLLIPKPLDSTYPSSSRRWPILSIFTSS